MRVSHAVLVSIIAGFAACSLAAQTPSLSSIVAPYPDLPSSVPITIGGVPYGSGTVAYGKLGTPLTLNGSNFGSSGTVNFVPYQNGIPGPPVQATVTSWSTSTLFLQVPPGAYTGLITVTAQGGTSNGLPFMVMPGVYSGICPWLGENELQILTSSLDDGAVGQSYSVTLDAMGGTQPYSWSITSGSLPSGLSLNPSSGVISGTPTAPGGPVALTVQATDSSSQQKTRSVSLDLTIDSTSQSLVYSYCVSGSPSAGCTAPTGGYDAVGNVVSYSDSVTGTWNMGNGYDNLNRLTAAQATAGAYQGLQANWSYDQFGNRTSEIFSGSLPPNAPGIPPSTSATYYANNQLQTESQNGAAMSPPLYDAAGNVICDSYSQSTGCLIGPGVNQYAYDAEGRICAVESASSQPMEYIYNAEGVRVAKGKINLVNGQLSCDTTQNGFQLTASYILDQDNQQLTELAWSNDIPSWAHTNVWAAGVLIGTYSATGSNPQYALNFYLTDWLGTRRVMTDSAGNSTGVCHSLPYGNGEDCTPAPTEHLFTGKVRDAESGNDYFGARYFESSAGRFISPDDASDQDSEDPQSWNLYAYVRNNPLINTDPDGHGCQSAHFWHTDSDGNTTDLGTTTDYSTCPNFGALWDLIQRRSQQAVQAVQQTVQHFNDIMSNPGGKACMYGAVTTGMTAAAIPSYTGALATGPFEPITGTAADILGGGGAGLTLGMAMCSAGSGGGSGGGGRTEHDEAQAGEPNRQVGDANRVIREGREYKDADSGYSVHVSGDRVVITDPADGDKIVTRFINSQANTQERVLSGKWIPQ